MITIQAVKPEPAHDVRPAPAQVTAGRGFRWTRCEVTNVLGEQCARPPHHFNVKLDGPHFYGPLVPPDVTTW
jgi:hypothetical protein